MDGRQIVFETPFHRSLAMLLSPYSSHVSDGSIGAHCSGQRCGLCIVLFNGMIANSCLIPAYRLSDSVIVTAAGVRQTPEYGRILRGFGHTNLHACGCCMQARLVAAYALLYDATLSSQTVNARIARLIRCDCIPSHRFERALSHIVDLKRKRP